MSKRIISIDVLRVIAILSVVLIHTSTKVLETSHYDLNKFWWTLFLNQIARFAVPLFFLISGFVLEITSDEKLKYVTFLKKRFGKILVPYLFWSLIYYFFIYTKNVDNLFWILLKGSASYQLYFIPTLCIFYLLFPILHLFYKYLSSPFVLALLGLIELYLLRQDYFIKNLQFIDPIRISLLGYLVFIAGIIIGRNKDRVFLFVKKWKYIFIGLTPILAIYIFNEGYSEYFKTFNINSFYSQWRISVLIYTLLLAASLNPFFENIKGLPKIFFNKLSELSFFVFFIHTAVLEFIWYFYKRYIVNNIIYDMSLFLIVATISFIVAYVFHKIPSLSKLTG